VRRYLHLVALLGLVCATVDGVARQRGNTADTYPKSFTIAIDFDRTSPDMLPHGAIRESVNSVLPRPKDWVAVWGTRAFAFDLNADGAPDYLVPLGCGATGYCEWGVFSSNPVRLRGRVGGNSLYLRARKGGWPEIVTTSGNISVTIARYRFVHGTYRHYGQDKEVAPNTELPRWLRETPFAEPYGEP
jgi:hypothetical protein